MEARKPSILKMGISTLVIFILYLIISSSDVYLNLFFLHGILDGTSLEGFKWFWWVSILTNKHAIVSVGSAAETACVVYFGIHVLVSLLKSRKFRIASGLPNKQTNHFLFIFVTLNLVCQTIKLAVIIAIQIINSLQMMKTVDCGANLKDLIAFGVCSNDNIDLKKVSALELGYLLVGCLECSLVFLRTITKLCKHQDRI